VSRCSELSYEAVRGLRPKSKTAWEHPHTAHNAQLEMPDRSGAEHKPVRRGREMIDLLAVEEPKPKPAKIRAVSYEAGIEQLFRRMRSFNEPNHRTSPSGRYCQPKRLEHRTYSSLCAAFAPQRLAVYSDENEQ
jgi:hypothetical protein